MRSHSRLALCLVCGLGTLLLTRVPGRAELPGGDDALAQGQKLFETHCALCHGPHGEGGKGPTLAQPKLPRATDDATLMRIIRDGLGGTEMPGARLDGGSIPLVASYVKSLGTRPMEPVPGDPQRGAQLYVQAQCSKCHIIKGEGGSYGPDLSDIGLKRSAAYLRRSITDPDSEVPQSFSARTEAGLPQNFLYVRVITKDGGDYSGVRVNEDTFSIQIREVPGKVRSFFKADLKELRKDWGKSPMPSYSGAFSPEQLDDLVAYMVSLREGK